MSTCLVYGYMVDGSGDPVEGVRIQFVPASLPAVNATTGMAVHPITLQAVSTSTGYFQKNLLVDTDFVVIIQSIGLKEKIRIPNVVNKNLFELTGTFVSGDPTPTDPTGPETNW